MQTQRRGGLLHLAGDDSPSPIPSMEEARSVPSMMPQPMCFPSFPYLAVAGDFAVLQHVFMNVAIVDFEMLNQVFFQYFATIVFEML